ncbi:MAG: DegT/DnrJ/EryC1/StrS family aminotransferase, partial [Aestuariivirga sp.]
TVNGAWMPTVVFAKELNITREQLMAAFKAENIDARVFFWPLSGLPSFEPVKQNSIAWDIPERAINLPSFHDMSEVEMDRVVKVLFSVR